MSTLRRFRFLLAATLCAAPVAVACSHDASDGVSSGEQDATERVDLFERTTALPLTLTAPVSTLFTRFSTGKADPVEPVGPDAGGARMKEPTFSEPGTLVLKGEPKADGTVAPDTSFDVRVYIRGESSKRDCPFRKLKVDFLDKEQLKGTPFKGHGTIRLNTHCGPGDVNARSGMGRVMNGVGPVREDVIYRMIGAARVPTYLTRVTKISYDDPAAKTTIDTYGMIMESGDDAAQRFAKGPNPVVPEGAVYLDQKAGEVTGKETPENAAQITVVQALVGNRDWFAGGTHNLDSFGLPQAPTVLKIPEDFDLCPIVMADERRAGAVSNASASLRTFGLAEHFVERKAAIEAALDAAEKDGIAAGALPSEDGTTTTDPGFVKAHERLNQFYALPELTSPPPAPVVDAGRD